MLLAAKYFSDGSYLNRSPAGSSPPAPPLPVSGALTLDASVSDFDSQTMQSKISSFFKPSSVPKAADASRPSFVAGDGTGMIEDHGTSPNRDRFEEGDCGNGELQFPRKLEQLGISSYLSKEQLPRRTKTLNKKRNYAQYHLELGQSDFLLHTCSTCQFKYACGDETDEKVHKEFHKNFCQGIPFKGWNNERVLFSAERGGDRIILVLHENSTSQRNKVDEILKFVARDLGLSDNWLLHALCKVYLFISCQRLVGVLIAEPIKTAYRVISSSDTKDVATITSVPTRPGCSDSTNLRLRDNVFQRSNIKKCFENVNSESIGKYDAGAIRCDKVPVSASCGVRAIWVAPSCRRKHIATRLLDVLRRSFCKGYIIEPSECAFSQPTSCGRMLASRYFGTDSFLVYHVSE